MPDLLHPEDLIQFAPLLMQGLLMTLLLSVTVMATALLLGMVIAPVRYYRVPVLAWLLDGYVYVVRSIPVVMLLALVHFGLLPALDLQVSFYVSAFIGLAASTTAYVAEILRGGFLSIHQEEHEAAISLGFTVRQRLVYVLIPLVISRMTPALVNQSVTLIKDTSLASIIGVIELTRAAEIIYERTLHEFTLLLFISLVYFVLCYSLSRTARKLEAESATHMDTLNWVRA